MPVLSIMDRMKQQETDLNKDMQRSFDTRNAGGRFRSLFKDTLPVPKLKIKNGEWILDFVPYFCGDMDPNNPPGTFISFLELWSHMWIGPNKDTFLCTVKSPMGGKQRCAGCEEVMWLSQNDAEENVIKQMEAKRRGIYYVVCYSGGEEQKGVQITDVSYHLLQKRLVEQSKQPTDMVATLGEFIRYAHPFDGKRVFFRHEGAKDKTRIEGIRFFDRPAPIPQAYFELVNQYPLDSLIAIPDYDAIKADFMAWRDMGNVQEPAHSPATVYTPPQAAGVGTVQQFTNPCPMNLVFGEAYYTSQNCFACVVKEDCVKEKMLLLKAKDETSTQSVASTKLQKNAPPVVEIVEEDDIPF